MKTDVSLVLNNGAGTWLNNFLHCFIYELVYVAIIRVFKTHYAMLSKGRDFFSGVFSSGKASLGHS